MTTAWQRFLPEGPIAFLPVSFISFYRPEPPLTSRIDAIAAALKKMPIELLPSLINAAFSLPYTTLKRIFALLTQNPPLPHLELAQALEILTKRPEEAYDMNVVTPELPPLIIAIQPESIASFPLKLSHADTYLGLPKRGKDLRTALVGDAAHTVHPMAGQGMNMGLGDVRALVDTLEKAVADGGDVGQSPLSRPFAYSRSRCVYRLI